MLFFSLILKVLRKGTKINFLYAKAKEKLQGR